MSGCKKRREFLTAGEFYFLTIAVMGPKSSFLDLVLFDILCAGP